MTDLIPSSSATHFSVDISPGSPWYKRVGYILFYHYMRIRHGIPKPIKPERIPTSGDLIVQSLKKQAWEFSKDHQYFDNVSLRYNGVRIELKREWDKWVIVRITRTISDGEFEGIEKIHFDRKNDIAILAGQIVNVAIAKIKAKQASELKEDLFKSA